MEQKALLAEELARERISDALKNDALALNLSPASISLPGKTFPGDERFRHLARLPSEIAALRNLRSLGLEETKISELSRITELTHLKQLYLNYTLISDVSAMYKLEEIEMLYMRDCAELKNLSPVGSLMALKEIDIERVPGMRDLSFLTESKSLEKIWAAGTKISDILLIISFPNLSFIDIRNTLVADLCPLARMQKLEVLKFSGTPACHPEADEKLALLSQLQEDEERTRQTLEYLRSKCPNEEFEGMEFDQEISKDEPKKEYDKPTNLTHDPQISSWKIDSVERLEAKKAINSRPITIMLAAADLHDRVEFEIAKHKEMRLNTIEAVKNIKFLESLSSDLLELSDIAERLQTEPIDAEIDRAVDEGFILRDKIEKYSNWVAGEENAREIANTMLIGAAAAFCIHLGFPPTPVTLYAIGTLKGGKLKRQLIDLKKVWWGE